MSKQLSLFGESFEISESEVLYNTYHKEFSDLAESNTKKFKDFYIGEANNVDGLIDKATRLGSSLIDESLRTVIKKLIAKGIYEVDANEFLAISDNKPMEFVNAVNSVKTEADKIDAMFSQNDGDKNNSSANYNGRAPLSAREQKKLEYLNSPRTVEFLLTGLYNDIFRYIKGYVKLLGIYKKEDVVNISDEAIRKSESIYNNLCYNLYEDKVLSEKMWIKMLSYYPYNVKFYSLLLKQHEECFDEIIELAKWYNIPMNKAAAELFAEKYSFKGINNLEDAEKRKQLLIEEMKKYNMDDSPQLIEADMCIERIKNINRTYLGVVYSSEEEKKQAELMDKTHKEWIASTNPSDLNAMINVYFGILNNEPEKRFVSIRQTNANVVGGMIINDVQNNPSHTADELNYYLNIFYNDPNGVFNQGVIQVMHKQAKKLNRAQNGIGGFFNKK